MALTPPTCGGIKLLEVLHPSRSIYESNQDRLPPIFVAITVISDRGWMMANPSPDNGMAISNHWNRSGLADHDTSLADNDNDFSVSPPGLALNFNCAPMRLPAHPQQSKSATRRQQITKPLPIVFTRKPHCASAILVKS